MRGSRENPETFPESKPRHDKTGEEQGLNR